MKKNAFPHAAWPVGFSATGLNADISYKKSRKDLALFYSHLPCVGAGVFTKNQVKAAPVVLSRERLVKNRGSVSALVINSGAANAATGKPGYQDALQCTKWVAEGLKISPEMVWAGSTGVIGVRIKLPKYKKGVKKIASRFLAGVVKEGDKAAEAIMTTDTVPKTADLVFDLGGVPTRIWGCAKGSGMIHPDLVGPGGKLHATMLSVIMTDAAIKPHVLQHALEKITDRTFNCVSIDGDTSTNDFVGVMANGGAGGPEIKHARGAAYTQFCRALMEISERLTTQIAMDGEGASCLVHIFVEGGRTMKGARKMAAVIASSPLVKTAIHGADPNWGRVLMALGRSGVPFDPQKVQIWFGETLMCDKGREIPFPEKTVIQYLKKKKVLIRVNLHQGNQWARYKTCDFTGHYVGINAGYRT